MSLQTTWTNAVVDAVLRGEREIIGLDREPYRISEHSLLGGPLLRGPWGSIAAVRGDGCGLVDECKRLKAACIHGQLLAARRACELVGTCIGFLSGYCQRCGGTSEGA